MVVGCESVLVGCESVVVGWERDGVVERAVLRCRRREARLVSSVMPDMVDASADVGRELEDGAPDKADARSR